MTIANIIETIEALLVENGMHADLVDYNGISVSYEIPWGDWKHDHLRLDWLIEKTFSNFVGSVTKETEGDESDCYSAIHTYWFSGVKRETP